MPIATTTALLIGSGIAAGTQLYGAHKAASGAKKAAETEATAARQASSDLKQTMQPYLDTGAQAMGTLGSLMGLGGGAPQPPGGAGLMPLPGAPAAQVQHNPQVGGAGSAGLGYMGNSPYASAGTYPNYAPQSDPAQRAMQQSQSGYAAEGGGSGRPALVQVRAPTGEIRMMPEDQARQFESRGATVIRG